MKRPWRAIGIVHWKECGCVPKLLDHGTSRTCPRTLREPQDGAFRPTGRASLSPWHSCVVWTRHTTLRCFSVPTVAKQRPARRRKQRLTGPDTIVTTRDRLRLLQETNRVVTPNLPRVGHQLLQVAQSRVSWLQNQLYTYWNPSYASSNGGTVVPTSGTTAAAPDETVVRQFQQGAVMDARWWFWNVLFALVPALGMVLYCELRGKHLMHDFHRSQELIELQKVLQQDEIDDNDTNDTNVETKRQRQVKLEATARAIQQARDKASRPEVEWYEQIRPLALEVVRLSSQWLLPEWLVTADSNPSKEEGDTPPIVHAPNPLTTERIATEQPVSSTTPRTPPQRESPPSLDELLLRIQELESALATAPLSVAAESETDTGPRHVPQQRLQRIQQSGVRNRVEDEAWQKWKPYLHAATTTVPPTTDARTEATANPDSATLASVSLDVVHTPERAGWSASRLPPAVWGMVQSIWSRETHGKDEADTKENVTDSPDTKENVTDSPHNGHTEQNHGPHNAAGTIPVATHDHDAETTRKPGKSWRSWW